MRPMRRKDREMPEEFAWAVADRCPWAVLAMAGRSGEPYCVPVSIAREGKRLYFHAARAGQKTDFLRDNPRVCLSCVGETRLDPAEFSIDYESAILRGTASLVTDDGERRHALELISQRYAPGNMEGFPAELEKGLPATAVWRIDVEEISGKRRPGNR